MIYDFLIFLFDQGNTPVFADNAKLELTAAHIDDAIHGRGKFGKARAFLKSKTVQRFASSLECQSKCFLKLSNFTMLSCMIQMLQNNIKSVLGVFSLFLHSSPFAIVDMGAISKSCVNWTELVIVKLFI